MELSLKELQEIITGTNDVRRGEQAKTDEYVIIRTYSAGVHAGFLKYRNGKEVILHKTRRLWYWTGAMSLSQLAQSGSSDISGCKFTEEVDKIILTEAIEIISVTDRAKNIIDSVPTWKK